MDKENDFTFSLDELSKTRLWTTLDKITDRLDFIDVKLESIIRLEEKIKANEKFLTQCHIKLDMYDARLRNTEQTILKLSGLIDSLQNGDNSISNLYFKVDKLESLKDQTIGKNKVILRLLNAVIAICISYIIYMLTTS